MGSCLRAINECANSVNQRDSNESLGERNCAAVLYVASSLMPLAAQSNFCDPCTVIGCSATSAAAVAVLKKYDLLPCKQTTSCDLLSLMSIQVVSNCCGCLQLAYCGDSIYPFGDAIHYVITPATIAYLLLKPRCLREELGQTMPTESITQQKNTEVPTSSGIPIAPQPPRDMF